MKRLDRYLLRESLPPLLFSLLLYSVLAIVSVTLPRVQWIVGAPLGKLAGWLLLQFPQAIVQTLPIALLLAVLLAFGRLAAANELLAMQAGGIAMRRVTLLFIVLGALGAAATLALNQRVLPSTNARVGAVYWQLTSGKNGLFRLAKQNIPLGDYTLYFTRADSKNDELYDVRLESWQNKTLTVVLAQSAHFVDKGLKLYGYQTAVLDLSSLNKNHADAAAALRDLLRAKVGSSTPQQSLTITTAESVDDLVTRFSGGGFEDTRSITGAYRDAHDPHKTPAQRRGAEALFQRQLAEPLANLTLLLVAVPLAVLYARSRSIAFGLSLVVTLVWYVLLTLGQLLAQGGALPVWLGVWAGNILLGLIGLYLLTFRMHLR